MMLLKLIIAGGQSGADRTGLECARDLGLETGGTAPKGWKTEYGPDPSLKEFGLVESPYSSYPPRTAENVKNASITIWFGNVGSPGYWCTKKAADRHCKMFIENPDSDKMKWIAANYESANIAGNRKSKNPKVVQLVRDAFKAITPSDDPSVEGPQSEQGSPLPEDL